MLLEVRKLIDTLRSEAPLQERIFSARALAQIGADADEAVPKLIEAVRFGESELRVESVKALGAIAIDSPEVLAVLTQGLCDLNPNVVFASAEALLKSEPNSFANALEKILRENLVAITATLDTGKPEERELAQRICRSLAWFGTTLGTSAGVPFLQGEIKELQSGFRPADNPT